MVQDGAHESGALTFDRQRNTPSGKGLLDGLPLCAGSSALRCPLLRRLQVPPCPIHGGGL
jgi:hypothetical protein